MKTCKLYIKDWLEIHPYLHQQPVDADFTSLASHIFEELHSFRSINENTRRKVALYATAYLEDLVSGLGLWRTFTEWHREQYGNPLPFYTVGPNYTTNEPNEEDLRFLFWNTLQKVPEAHPYIDPLDEALAEVSRQVFPIVDEAYESIPENEILRDFFIEPGNEEETHHKLEWLFGRTYLTESSVQAYIGQISRTDRFLIPCGPSALFLYEWIERLTSGCENKWRQVEGLYPVRREIPEDIKQRNRETFRHFLEGTDGAPVTYLNGYEALRRFLTGPLGWPDDANHTLPQMREHQDFVLMSHPEKGILLAKDLSACIADPLNPMYKPETAAREAFRLLTVPTLCPPDLLAYVLEHGYLPDAQFPSVGRREMVQKNADFIARHALLYYYRGD